MIAAISQDTYLIRAVHCAISNMCYIK